MPHIFHDVIDIVFVFCFASTLLTVYMCNYIKIYVIDLNIYFKVCDVPRETDEINIFIQPKYITRIGHN